MLFYFQAAETFTSLVYDHLYACYHNLHITCTPELSGYLQRTVGHSSNQCSFTPCFFSYVSSDNERYKFSSCILTDTYTGSTDEDAFSYHLANHTCCCPQSCTVNDAQNRGHGRVLEWQGNAFSASLSLLNK